MNGTASLLGIAVALIGIALAAAFAKTARDSRCDGYCEALDAARIEKAYTINGCWCATGTTAVFHKLKEDR